MQATEGRQEQKNHDTLLGAAVAFLLIPFVFAGACLAVPGRFAMGWIREHREHKFRMLMKKRGRLITWQEFLRAMHGKGGTCIEERFSPKGPVRFWWTPENVQQESPYEIINWFTMRKGRGAERFIRWCRERYTSAETGSAVLVDAALVAKRDLYVVWSECRSDASMARWVEVAPPEIIPHPLSQ